MGACHQKDQAMVRSLEPLIIWREGLETKLMIDHAYVIKPLRK